MNYLTHQLLNPQEINLLKKNLNIKDLPWEDGKKTAGNHAAKVKNNLQLPNKVHKRHFLYLALYHF